MLLGKANKCFLAFKERETIVKMKKLNKNKSLASSWESPFIFVRDLDGRGFYNMMKEEGFMWLRERMRSSGRNLRGICNCSMLQLPCED